MDSSNLIVGVVIALLVEGAKRVQAIPLSEHQTGIIRTIVAVLSFMAALGQMFLERRDCRRRPDRPLGNGRTELSCELRRVCRRAQDVQGEVISGTSDLISRKSEILGPR
jgi:hypothetical protein